MLAHAVEADVADQHHLVVLLGEEFAEVDARVVVQAGEQLGVHAGDAGRRFAQTFAIGVFADGGENFADGALDAGCIDAWSVRRGIAVVQFAGEAAEIGAAGDCRCRLFWA